MRSDFKNQILNEYLELHVDPQLQIVAFRGTLFEKKKIGDGVLPGRHLSKVFKGFWAPDIRSICVLALNRGETGSIVHEMRHNGAYLALEVAAAPDVKEARIVGIVVLVKDVTIAIRQERRRALTSKMKTISQLASEIVHKMNNPIAAILNQIGGMLVENLNDTPAESFRFNLQEIQEQLYAVSLVTNSLTAFSTETNLDFKLIQVNDVIENAVNLLQLLENNRTIHYHVALDGSLPRILGSEVTLEQGLVNILKNAIEAMPDEGGDLSITSRVDEHFQDFIAVSIRDNGHGIAPENMDYIVDPFFTTKDSDHNGLGLSVSYGIFSNHNGSIEIASTPGEGTSVTILLPIANV